MSTRQQSVTSVSLPAESSITTLYPTIHLADAYSIALPSGASKDPEVLARFIFSQLPSWMIGLMRVRDTLVSAFGLKTAKQLKALGANDQQGRIGAFKLYSRGPSEIVMGEDDKHLDFRLSLLCSNTPSPLLEQRLTLSTVVHCHNRLGRLYIFLIAPFHRLVTRSSLSHAAKVGWPAAAER